MTYIVRHAVSRANDKNDLAFNNPEAGLIPIIGPEQMQPAREFFAQKGYDPYTPVATSDMKRARQSTLAAGFFVLRYYAPLNEVDLPPEQKGAIKYTRDIPEDILEETKELLRNPPAEEIWVTHGLRAASIFKILEIYQNFDEHDFVMKFGEVRKLPDNWQNHPNLRYNTP